MRHNEPATWWQGDREISAEDIVYMRTAAKRFPGLSRTELTDTLCEHLDWLTPAGRPKYTACAKLLVRLEVAGELCRPCFQTRNSHPGPRPGALRRPSARTDPAAPFERPLSAIDPVRLRLASDAQEKSLWNDFVERYHPLGYKKPFGYRARYFIESGSHVDPTHFRCSCYRTTGWTRLGRTSGEGLVRPGKQYRTSPKLIFIKALQADVRALLCSDQLEGRTER